MVEQNAKYQLEVEKDKKPIKFVKKDKILYRIVVSIYFLILIFIVMAGYFAIKSVNLFKESLYKKSLSNDIVIDEKHDYENMMENENSKIEEEIAPDEVQNEMPATPVISEPIPTPKPVCTNRYTIREGDFASDKCYSTDDFNDLLYYLNKYNDAAFNYNAAANKANVTCNGFTEEFENLCKEARDTMDKYDDNMDEYKNMVKSILNKGTSFSKFQ